MTLGHLLFIVSILLMVLYVIPIIYPNRIISILNITPPKEHFIKPKIVPNSSLIYYEFICKNPKATIIYVQGGMSRPFHKHNIKICNRLSFFNYNVYMFNYRKIPREIPLITSCTNDLNDMYNHVMSTSDLPCVFVAYSFGAVVVSNFRKNVACAVLLAPLGSFKKHLYYLYPFLNSARLQNSRVFYKIDYVKHPTLILNSSSDIVAPSSISNSSYKGNVYFHTIDNFTHSDFNSMYCIKTIDQFITLHI